MYPEKTTYDSLQKGHNIVETKKVERGAPRQKTEISSKNTGSGTKDLLSYKYGADFKYKDPTEKPNFVAENELESVRKDLYSGRRRETGYKRIFRGLITRE